MRINSRASNLTAIASCPEEAPVEVPAQASQPAAAPVSRPLPSLDEQMLNRGGPSRRSRGVSNHCRTAPGGHLWLPEVAIARTGRRRRPDSRSLPAFLRRSRAVRRNDHDPAVAAGHCPQSAARTCAENQAAQGSGLDRACLRLEEDLIEFEAHQYEDVMAHLPACLGSLGQSARAALDLRYQARLRLSEIGEKLHRSEGGRQTVDVPRPAGAQALPGRQDPGLP